MFGFFKKKKREILIPKMGLCLSGGGARGFAHIGAIKAFEEAGIDFDLVVGVSAGSIVGALYAFGKTAEEMTEYGAKLDMKSVHNGVLPLPNDASKIGKIVTDFIGDENIESFRKKFACVAVDLVEARQIVINSGSVGEAVSASSCVPGLFKPVVSGERHLVDGGLLNNIPADVCKMLGAEKVITVDVNPTRGGGTSDTSLLSVVKATVSIMTSNSSIAGLKNSDVVIAPDLSGFSASSKEGWREMIELGYEEAKKHIEEIKNLTTGEWQGSGKQEKNKAAK